MPLQLNAFLPYQLRRTYAAINHCLSEVYEGRYELTQPEWRVMAIVARDMEITSTDIAAAATIDKVAVSRAVTRLEAKNLVERIPNQNDGRSMLLTLSREGQAIYDKMSAELLKVEAQLMQGLKPEERDALLRLLATLEANANTIA
ncbi:MarR family transcriptional regulator [uncultured Litoreibacter sp.]|uniref:MarR family winged helix-turn-helix transcriptional regulator n=1 Tax=uncultured Litoreibacter sp. TaxID=1392394 RepID=UPI002631ACF5|nr:MarR family transcriptional regulator [uncultured Litoreibacter sp.]